MTSERIELKRCDLGRLTLFSNPITGEGENSAVPVMKKCVDSKFTAFVLQLVPCSSSLRGDMNYLWLVKVQLGGSRV